MLIELTESLLVWLFAVVLTPIFNPHVTTTTATTRNHKPHQPWHVPQYFYDQYLSNDFPLPQNAFAPKNVPEIAFNAELDGQSESSLFGPFDLKSSEGNKTFWQPYPGNNTFPDWFTKIMRAGYYSAVSMSDYHIGRVLDKLEELDLVNDTVVVFVADHG